MSLHLRRTFALSRHFPQPDAYFVDRTLLGRLRAKSCLVNILAFHRRCSATGDGYASESYLHKQATKPRARAATEGKGHSAAVSNSRLANALCKIVNYFIFVKLLL